MAAGVEHQLHKVMETGDPLIDGGVDAETPAHPGVVRTFQHSYYPRRSKDGRIVGVSCVVVDITKRKRAEEALRDAETRSRTLLEGSPVCTKIIDLDFRLLYMSAAGQQQLKISDVQPLYGCPYPPDFYSEAMRAPLVKHLERAKAGEISSVECPVLDTEGDEVWYHTTFVPAHDDEGRIKYIIVTSVDITERKRAEEELRIHAVQQEAVAKLGQRALASREIPGLLNEAVALVQQTLNVPLCKVLELLPEGNQLLLKAGVGWKEGYVGPGRLPSIFGHFAGSC